MAAHIAGCDNVKADHLSHHRVERLRRLEHSTEGSLNHGMANVLFSLWGVPMVELFATRLNNKVNVFYSCLPDTLALQENPLQVDWSQGLLYMYPPPPCHSCPLLCTM